MAILATIALGVLALVFVLYPLLRQRWDKSAEKVSPEQTVTKEAPPKHEHEQAARMALHEVELDYQLGNIVEDDYRSLRERYMRRALVSMKARYERDQELDDEIEEQLRKMKEQEKDASQES